jgi:hypothetical protein
VCNLISAVMLTYKTEIESNGLLLNSRSCGRFKSSKRLEGRWVHISRRGFSCSHHWRNCLLEKSGDVTQTILLVAFELWIMLYCGAILFRRWIAWLWMNQPWVSTDFVYFLSWQSGLRWTKCVAAACLLCCVLGTISLKWMLQLFIMHRIAVECWAIIHSLML